LTINELYFFALAQKLGRKPLMQSIEPWFRLLFPNPAKALSRTKGGKNKKQVA
jgi:hypothetical protein